MVAGLTKLPVIRLWIDNLCFLVQILITTCQELIKETCKATGSPKVRSFSTRIISSYSISYRGCILVILIKERLHP